jgi:hypothetical protein
MSAFFRALFRLLFRVLMYIFADTKPTNATRTPFTVRTVQTSPFP